MCCPTPSVPGCSCPTCPYTSFFGMANGWWPYSAWFLGIYGGYTAGGWHPPWYLMMGTTYWYPASADAPLPIHCLGTDTLVNGLLNASFSAMWTSLIPRIQTIYGSMYLAHADSGVSVLLNCLQLSPNPPQNMCTRQSALTFFPCFLMFSNPARTASTPCFCGAFIPNKFLVTRNKSKALNFWCRTTLELGVVFLKIFQNFWGDMIYVFFFSSSSSISQISCAFQRMKTII